MFSLFIEGEMASARVFIVFMQMEMHYSDPSRSFIITKILNNHKYICSFIKLFAALDIREDLMHCQLSVKLDLILITNIKVLTVIQ